MLKPQTIQKLYPETNLFLYAKLNDEDRVILFDAIGRPLLEFEEEAIEYVINVYLQAIDGHVKARTHKELKNTFAAIRDAVSSFSNELEKLTGENFSARHLGSLAEEFESIEEAEDAVQSVENADLLATAFAFIEKEALFTYDKAFSLEDFARSLDILQGAADSLSEKFTKKTGRPGDPFFSTLVADLLHIYNAIADVRVHSEGPYSFIHAAARIAERHLGQRGLLADGVKVHKLSKSAIQEWVKLARSED
ncbi:hypothetical protein [Azospirillum soli]|uniref:hypothetical protein n=1 Tax=Azospirillum soli TaxID=1304799 RepID=UPI001AE5B83A|nr:hypothetical protein [Azospirillum soli]MBP2312936.1 hypothetical protein [Azospirillum soli]